MAHELPGTTLQAMLVSPVLAHLDLQSAQAEYMGRVAAGTFSSVGDARRREELMSEMVTLDEIRAAQQRIAGVAVRTPLYRLERGACQRLTFPNLRTRFT